jgi:hydroxyacylglutathione hydrolase
MLVTGFPAGTFQTNCWLVAAEQGAEALVVDPGQDALAGIEELCRGGGAGGGGGGGAGRT